VEYGLVHAGEGSPAAAIPSDFVLIHDGENSMRVNFMTRNLVDSSTTWIAFIDANYARAKSVSFGTVCGNIQLSSSILPYCLTLNNL
jgi:hypothetical protein